MKLLNLGCGYRFHRDWVNVDFTATGDGVIAHDLTRGVPFPDNHFDAVYHSHVLEHFSKAGGAAFIRECFRVTKPGGVIRVAVPDLERIAREYLQQLDGVLAGNADQAPNYDWMMLELYDQAVRDRSGGEMAQYLFRDHVENLDFVYTRLGHEARHLRETFLRNKEKSRDAAFKSKTPGLLTRLFSLPLYKKRMKRFLFKDEGLHVQVGRFRMSGEIHQWMYDRYSLGRLLLECGFHKVSQQSAFQSTIPGWDVYQLDAKDGIVRKPDSLFMEAVKPQQ
jgi:predicted SAM-dependent methyltransferase